ncbi:MAG: MFS transporter [Planctomycetota bacterium]
MNRTGRSALGLVLLLGVVSLFADMTYEAARSITGPYLAVLGASATAVGIVAGLGELVGYGLRLVAGAVTDRIRRLWAITIAGYAVNLLAVPALALAGSWEVAAALVVTERLGKAIRAPARDAILAHATHGMGRGWGFGLHEALDQIGATVGPLIVAGVLFAELGYARAFAVLAVPAGLALATLGVARAVYPHPHLLEPAAKPDRPAAPRATFALYLAAAACLAAGFVDFPLVAFHMKRTALLNDAWIPVVYAGAMGIDALSALACGWLYDRKGLSVLTVVAMLSAASAPLVFLGGPELLLAGMVLWGIGMGAMESVVRAVVAELVPRRKRATGYGVFLGGFGLAWFVGSAAMGVLYERSLLALAVFSVGVQLASLPLLGMVRRRLAAGGGGTGEGAGMTG